MPIYHLSVKNIGRSAGRSAIAASAYRSGTELLNKEDGVIHNFTKKKNVIYSEIDLPQNAPEAYKDRETLWNEVQKIESQKDARLAREFEIALPKELTLEEQIKAGKMMAAKLTAEGMCVDWSIHEPDHKIRNPHIHMMVTTRSILEDGKWAPKTKKVYLVDKNGEKEKIYLKNDDGTIKVDADGEKIQKTDSSGRKQYRTTKEDYNDWNYRGKVDKWREDWENIANSMLPKENKIDRRTLKEQGIDRVPTIHEGYAARAIKARTGHSYKCDYNDIIRVKNLDIASLDKLLQKREQDKQELQMAIKKAVKKAVPEAPAKLKKEIAKVEVKKKPAKLRVYSADGIERRKREIEEIQDAVNEIAKAKAQLFRLNTIFDSTAKENLKDIIADKEENLRIYGTSFKDAENQIEALKKELHIDSVNRKINKKNGYESMSVTDSKKTVKTEIKKQQSVLAKMRDLGTYSDRNSAQKSQKHRDEHEL